MTDLVELMTKCGCDKCRSLLPKIKAKDDEIERLEAEVEKALAFGYHYRQNPQMRGSSLHACKAVYREQAGGRDDG
jgi:hypothetical protein